MTAQSAHRLISRLADRGRAILMGANVARRVCLCQGFIRLAILDRRSTCKGAALDADWGQMRPFHSPGPQVYFGGCNSPFNQRVAVSVFIGSGRSQSRHWSVRGPLPPGGSARSKCAPQWGQVGRSAWPTPYFAARPKAGQLKSEGRLTANRDHASKIVYDLYHF